MISNWSRRPRTAQRRKGKAMAWEIVERLEDKIAIWRNREELRGKPYAVSPLGPAGWVEPVAGQFEFLSEARAAARERLQEYKAWVARRRGGRPLG